MKPGLQNYEKSVTLKNFQEPFKEDFSIYLKTFVDIVSFIEGNILK